MSNPWPDRRHRITPAERQKGHESRTRNDRKAASKKGWITRRKNGGYGLTNEERMRGSKIAGAIARDKGHDYFVELGRASGRAKRARAASKAKGA